MSGHKVVGLCMVLVMGVVASLGRGIAAKAQTDLALERETVVVCVDFAEDLTEAGPYLMGFRQAPMLGFVLPRQATITVYSAASNAVSVKVQHVLPDAQTGGFRRAGIVAAAYTTQNIVRHVACEEQASEFLGEDLRRSISFDVTPDQGVFIDRVEHDGARLDTVELMGALALHFVPTSAVALTDIQLIQMDETEIDIFFPYMPEHSELALIVNKDMALEVCFGLDAEADCTRPQLVNELGVFVQYLAQMTPPVDLYDVMRAGLIRVFPAWGLVIEYPHQGALRLSLSDSPAEREPAFTANQAVHPIDIDGIQARYFKGKLGTVNDVIGNIDGQSPPLPVVGVDAQGQLLVLVGGEELVLEAWLVEVE